MIRFWSVESDPAGQGRIAGARPVAVLDIGSNSVRLVVYERHARALTVLYNEKSSSGLGRGVAATGHLAEETMAKALRAIKRFALVCRLMDVGDTFILATSATREARNGPEFVKAVEAVMEVPVRVLSGSEEAHYAALGVAAGIPGFDGIVGDLGGGSLELALLKGHNDREGETHGLGAIRLQDDSAMNIQKAQSIAVERLSASGILKKRSRKTFCAIGGTWRALAKLHQARTQYPLHMVQEYVVPATEISAICDLVIAGAQTNSPVSGMASVSSSRRDLLPYGAAVLSAVLREGGFETVVFSALGVREGYLFDQLSPEDKAIDPLLESTREMSLLRARAPAFAEDLIASSEALFRLLETNETADQSRLRKAACYISDIGWRAHPDYRGEQSVDMVAFSDIVGIGHPGRAYLAQTLAFRYMGFKQKSASAKLLALAGEVNTERARIMGAFFRVAYPLAAGMPGILSRTRFSVSKKALLLHLPADLAFLDGERLRSRLRQLALEVGCKSSAIEVD